MAAFSTRGISCNPGYGKGIIIGTGMLIGAYYAGGVQVKQCTANGKPYTVSDCTACLKPGPGQPPPHR